MAEASRDIAGLIAIMARLRDPQTGCEWDRAQTHASLAPYALEEAYEVVEAIDRGSAPDLCDELGDVLFQVVFHARVAEEAGHFAFGDVVTAITAKMIRRHPHIFADDHSQKTGLQRRSWEQIKADERRDREPDAVDAGLLADVARTSPALTRAVKLQQKAAMVGFDWDDVRVVLAKVREEVDEIEDELARGSAKADIAAEIGDLLFAVSNLARHTGIDPEAAARLTNAKFERRFAFIERQLAAKGSSPGEATLDEMDALWDEAKANGL